MKKFFILFLFSAFWLPGFCQQVGIFAGYGKNNFYDLTEENPHFISIYNYGNAANLGVRFERFKIIDKLRSDTFQLSMAVKFTYYSGKIDIETGGLGSGIKTVLRSKKYIVGLDIIPLNIRIYKELRLSLGGEISFLLSSENKGYRSGWSRNSASSFVSLEDTTIKFNHPVNIGLNLNLDYSFGMGGNFYFVPLYNFYFGLTNEFNNLGTTIRSYRHSINLGVAKRL